MSKILMTVSLVCAVGNGMLTSTHSPRAAWEREKSMDPASSESASLVRRSIPDEDPGPPFYARVGLQFFDDGEWIAIPFYRPPTCVPPEFNLLSFFHVPGPGGAGAFACPLLMSGFLLTEPDALPTTFPLRVVLEGSDVPVWFAPSAAFAAGTADGTLTIGELEQLQPRRGIAASYHETLHPREGDHLIVIVAHGALAGGQRFSFHATHVRDRIVSLRIAFEAP